MRTVTQPVRLTSEQKKTACTPVAVFQHAASNVIIKCPLYKTLHRILILLNFVNNPYERKFIEFLKIQSKETITL